tara:strand:+ start:284 stop:1168 length:885 start_codon:yes stop_codon:yes gene_type:complete
MARKFKNYYGGGESLFDKINEINNFTPISNAILYSFFIVFSLIVIIMLIWQKDASNINWFISFTHLFIRFLLLILALPVIPIIINIIKGIFNTVMNKFSFKKEVPPSMLGGSNEYYMNFDFINVILKGLKILLVDSFHTFITFFLVISYFTIIEQSTYFNNVMNFINFIFIMLLILYTLTILFKINNSSKQQNILAFIILLMSLNFLFTPLFFILTKIISWGKDSDNFFVNLLILIIFAILGIGINYYRLKYNEDIKKVDDIYENIIDEIKQFSKSDPVKYFSNILNTFINTIF